MDFAHIIVTKRQKISKIGKNISVKNFASGWGGQLWWDPEIYLGRNQVIEWCSGEKNLILSNDVR